MKVDRFREFFSWRVIAILGGFFFILFLGWFFFFGALECDSRECFNEYLRSCDAVTYVGGTDMVFEYTILDKVGDSCQVNLKLLQGELNNRESEKLDGLEMVCDVPYGTTLLPESEIGECHGLLKEGLQDLIIEKLHTYLVQNLGSINLELINISTN